MLTKLLKAYGFLVILVAIGNLLIVPLNLVLGEYAEAATHAVIGVAILVLLAMVAPVKPKARRI
jgi:hypothetical protein